MEGIVAVFLLLVVGAIALVVWLINKAITLSSTVSELGRRLDWTEGELRKLKKDRGSVDKAQEEPTPAGRQMPSILPQFITPVAKPEFLEPPPIIPAGPAPAYARESANKPDFAPAAEEPTLSFNESLKTSPPPSASPARLPTVNWEQFMGVKLFAWIGGLALFLGVAFFVKYSFDNNLISPAMRVGIGFLTGLSLLVGGVILKQKDYAVTAQTLCATGVVILYASTFACHSIYRFPFFALVPTFLLMALITTTAFLLAVRLDAQVVAVLGMVGGFLTPVLLSTGVDNPAGLFGYVALLDAGLVAVGLKRRWHYLVFLGALGTVLMQLGWVGEFFRATKVFIAISIFLGFAVFFLLAFAAGRKAEPGTHWLSASTLGVSFVALGFVFYLLTFPELTARPGVIFGFVFTADLCLLAPVLLDRRLHYTHLASGAAVFLVLTVWTSGFLTSNLLLWALGVFLVFAVLHTVYPVVLQRLRPDVTPVWWGHLFPPLALLLVMVPMFRFTEVSWLIWPCVLLIDVLAIGLALLTASLTALIGVLLLTVAATAVWVLRFPLVIGNVPELLLVIGGFGMLFFIVGLFAGRKSFGSVTEALQVTPGEDPLLRALGIQASPALLQAQLPALSATLPFLLLIMVVMKLPLVDPSPVFGLAALMIALLLAVTRLFKVDALAAVALGCTLALELAWHQHRFSPLAAAVPLAWYLGFFAMFAVFPFLFRRAFEARPLTWIVAALSGPAHFYLVHNLIKTAWPNAYMGLVPAAFALASLASLTTLVRQFPPDSPRRLTLLAWFGGVSLFFITLVFPIQFERQWVTLGWALEGAALLWLSRRVPHPGLPPVGVSLLLLAFVRLALNPAVLLYQPRSETPILNWYLYAYGIVTLCLFAGAWFLRRPRHLVLNTNTPPLLIGLGTVLAFLLVNIEIADYFTLPGALRLTFEFSGNFGRDMCYTIAWALYALMLVAAGIWKRAPAFRYAGLGLLSVTLLKLFFHDLAQLAHLYRIGALVAVAVIAIFASFLYQRFFARSLKPGEKPEESEVSLTK